MAFISNLTHAKGRGYAGQPFELRAWQETIIRQLFGTVRPDGLRRYRTALLMLPRKNGKSELAAAIALYGLMGDGEHGAEVYCAAADREQASLVFNVMASMIRNDPELAAECEIADSQRRIRHIPSGSICRAISADAYSKHGFNASLIVYDELHAAPNRELWDVLTTSQGARKEPLTLAISTAGFDRHSILYELYAHACAVRDGLAKDPSFISFIYEAPKDADWTDEKVWGAANPALGDFRELDEMRVLAQRAVSIPAQQNTFRRLYLNQWTESVERWLDGTAWDACSESVDEAALIGRACYAGLDLAATTDIAALVLVFPDEDGSYDVVSRFWVPEDGARKRAERDRAPYLDWIEQGYVASTPGNVTDYDAIREAIHELAERYDLRALAYDRWGATQLVTQLTGDGANCVPMGQGFASMSAPAKELEKLVLGKWLRHGGNPVLRWMAGNVCVEQDAAGNIKPSKRKSTERIDGIVALCMAIDQATRQTAESTDSVYDTRGIAWLA